MPDLLVNLLKLPATQQLEQDLFTILRAQPFESSTVRRFIEENFSLSWADETAVGFANKPVTVFVATIEHRLVGFAAYECTRRNYFGPTGVVAQARGRGIGQALLLASLWAMREMGYVYAIIGGVGPVDFYQKTVGAIVIPGSDPGIYTDSLKE